MVVDVPPDERTLDLAGPGSLAVLVGPPEEDVAGRVGHLQFDVAVVVLKGIRHVSGEPVWAAEPLFSFCVSKFVAYRLLFFLPTRLRLNRTCSYLDITPLGSPPG